MSVSRVVLSLFVSLFCVPLDAVAADWFVAAGATGNGSSTAPFGAIQAALNVAQPGDVIVVRPGMYAERITTRRHGMQLAPITLRAEAGRGSVLVTVANEVLQVSHANFVVDGMIFDAQYALEDAVEVTTGGSGFILRDSEVRHATRDCVDIASPSSVLIEDSLIHHCLNAGGGRTDAHGVVAGAIQNLTLRNTEIHTFSGDALQVDPGRAAPGWGTVTVERCRFWLQPLAQSTNGFPSGTVPGENAIDTKTLASAPRGRLIIRDTIAYGFRNGLTENMAAFNLKENIDALIDGVTVYDSDIAFRARGPGANGSAWVQIQNALVYSVNQAVRYEDNIERLEIFNVTIGANVARAFDAASSGTAGLDVRNMLLLAATKPKEASDASNLAVDASHFVNVSANDYRLIGSSLAVDTGLEIAEVTADRLGTPRPQGLGYDVGAYELAQDAVPEVTIGNVSLLEPVSTGVAVFPVRLSVASTRTVRVAWTTRAKTATAGADFVAANGTVTFSPGQVLSEVRISVLGDLLDEAVEAFDVALSNPEEATIADGVGRARITDDDPPPEISIVPSSTVAESTINQSFTIQVWLSAPSGRIVTTNFTTADLTARASLDYVAAAGSVSFAPGVTTQTITLTVLADATVEPQEYFKVLLSNATNGTIVATSSIITITDVSSP